jgi:hypothetical protein
MGRKRIDQKDDLQKKLSTQRWRAKICRLFSVLFFALVFQQGTDELRATGNVVFGKMLRTWS